MFFLIFKNALKMEEINNLYQEIQDIESLIVDFNKTKTQISFFEQEIITFKNKLNPEYERSLKLKIDNLENQYKKIENEIRKTDLSSKECYTILEIKALFEFLNDQKLIMEKCLSFTNSLIYDLKISCESFATISQKKENVYGTYKLLKISKDINDFFSFLKNDFYINCYNRIKELLFEEMVGVLVCDIEICEDDSYFYLFWFLDDKQLSVDLKCFNSVKPVDIKILKKSQIADIFLEIFKLNLSSKLLQNKLESDNLITTNKFLENSEYFITNIDEWKLDCIMKEIIKLSKSQKSHSVIEIQEDLNFLPRYISEELYKFFLCISVFKSIDSKRIAKAKKLIDRALIKLLIHEDFFILFADVSFAIQKFKHQNFLEIKEKAFMSITRKCTEIEKNLQENSLILKVYFKEKYFDFKESLKMYVPKNYHMLFETTFFNLIYINVINNILCMTYLENEKIRELADTLSYLIEMSFNISKDSIESFEKIKSTYILLTTDIEKILDLYVSRQLFLESTEIIILINLIFKECKTKKLLINRIQQDMD